MVVDVVVKDALGESWMNTTTPKTRLTGAIEDGDASIEWIIHLPKCLKELDMLLWCKDD